MFSFASTIYAVEGSILGFVSFVLGATGVTGFVVSPVLGVTGVTGFVVSPVDGFSGVVVSSEEFLTTATTDFLSSPALAVIS